MQPKQRKAVRRAAFVVGGIVLAFVAFRGVLGILVWDAQRWCEGLAPRLEAWQAEHGQYPATLNDLGDTGRTPILCRPREASYNSRHGEYILDVTTGPMSGIALTSRDGQWHRYD
jgi:hypothetical protein